MALIFQLNCNGSVTYLHRPFSKQIKEKDYEENFSKMKFEDFLVRYVNKKHQEELRIDMRRLKKINKLSKMGPKLEVDDQGKFVLSGFCIGHIYFKDFYNSSQKKRKGLEVATKIYGKNVVESLIKEGFFDKPSKEEIENSSNVNEFIRYYFDNAIIDKEGYQALYKIIKDLSRVRDIKNPMDKINVFESNNKI